MGVVQRTYSRGKVQVSKRVQALRPMRVVSRPGWLLKLPVLQVRTSARPGVIVLWCIFTRARNNTRLGNTLHRSSGARVQVNITDLQVHMHVAGLQQLASSRAARLARLLQCLDTTQAGV